MEGLDRELAIYIGDFDTQSQFYTMSGSWVHRKSRSVPFSVSHFVEPHELDALKPYLPKSDVPAAMQDKLHGMSQLVPRSAGQSLIRKMADFWAQADAVYLANSVKLDRAHKHVALPKRLRYATLDEIARDLLPRMAKNREDGKLPNPALYAVHRCLLSEGVGFKAPLKRALRAGGHYEIMAMADMDNMQTVRLHVRKYIDSKFARRSNTTGTTGDIHLADFVAKVQRRIDISRRTRQFTPHGTVGPIHAESSTESHENLPPLRSTLNEMDMRFVRFLESWTALRYCTDFSPLNGTAATILRAVNRYEDVGLNQGTGWTFLQEIGAMAPWESRSAFDLRLANTGLGHPRKLLPNPEGFVPDKLKGIRKDWGDLPVYCIDSSDAHEIDDGISIEKTNTPGQYWLHIHTADPGSHMSPAGPTAQYAEELVETVYMPDRVVTMLPSTFVKGKLSLAQNRPCLTYSARIATTGELLEYNVTAGMLGKVRHITPRVVQESVLQSTFSKRNKFHLVGPDLPPSEPRRMVKGDELSDLDKENLRILHEIGKVHTERRIARGAFVNHIEDFSVSVSMNGWEPTKTAASNTYQSDPSIQISMPVVDSSVRLSVEEEGFNVVAPAMMIAGEVAARWCKDRGIPIIHRVTARNDDKEDPAEFFVKNVLPTRNEQGSFDLTQVKALFNLLGLVQPSTTPGPHFSMGLEMFARCTSPLRRYPDLLLGWQVGSALLEEARLGHSLVGNKKDDFLAFTKAKIDALLPHIDSRERLISFGKRRAKEHWLHHYFLRAWKYGQGSIPRTFSFVLRDIVYLPDRDDFLRGMIDHFQLSSKCECPDWATLEEFKPGDILEVELKDVNIYYQSAIFKALRRMDASEKEALDKENFEMMQSQEII